jgi:Transposase.
MENITSDETWIFQYDVQTKRQSMHWKIPASPRMKKARMSKSKFKAMLIIFFDISGIVMTEWVPEGQTEPNLLFESFGNTARESS